MISASSMAGGAGGRGPEFRAAQPVTRDPWPKFFAVPQNNISTIATLSEKFCGGCQKTLPASDFGRHRKTKDGLRSVCRACNNLKAKAWAAADPEKARGYWRQQYAKNPGPRRAKAKAWYAANKDRHRETGDRLRTENIDRYRERACAVAARRRARRLLATPAWADQEKIAAMYRAAQIMDMHVDHIVPLVSPIVCGLHVEHNLQLLDGIENRQKGNRYWPDMP